VIPAGIGVMLLDQGAIGRLDLGRRGGGGNPQHAIGIGGGQSGLPQKQPP
jgi:hypothetical protein